MGTVAVLFLLVAVYLVLKDFGAGPGEVTSVVVMVLVAGIGILLLRRLRV
jgi:hypothetical protein